MRNSAFDSFSEAAQETLDFARCQRPDGSFYGTGGQCRKGTQVGDKEKEPKTKSQKKGAEVRAALGKIVGETEMGSTGLDVSDGVVDEYGGKLSKGNAKELMMENYKYSLSKDILETLVDNDSISQKQLDAVSPLFGKNGELPAVQTGAVTKVPPSKNNNGGWRMGVNRTEMSVIETLGGSWILTAK